MFSARRETWLGAATMLGGVLWVLYGVGEMLEPWGAAKIYVDDLGYELVTNIPLFRAYSLPGSLALCFTALGLLTVSARYRLAARRVGTSGAILAYLAAGVGALSAVGAVILFVPVFFAGITFGTLILGAASLLLGLAARPAAVPSFLTATLLAVGVMGLLLFPLRPLVFALMWVSEGVAAVLMATFGLGWLVVGYHLWSARRVGTARPGA